MRVPVLVKISAGLCALYSVVHLISVAVLTYRAPGYFDNLRGGPMFQIIILMAISLYGLGTAVGLLRRSGWARLAIQPLACVWMLTFILNMWVLAKNDAAAQHFIAPAVGLWITMSWLLLFNAQRTRSYFTR